MGKGNEILLINYGERKLNSVDKIVEYLQKENARIRTEGVKKRKILPMSKSSSTKFLHFSPSTKLHVDVQKHF